MKNTPELYFSHKLPDREGYYWWTDFGEHTPTIVYVSKEKDGFAAQNEEFCFVVSKVVPKEQRVDGDNYSDELWCYIPNPILPTCEIVEPKSY